MAITNVQAKSKNDNNVGSSSPLTLNSNNTAGNILVLTIVWTPRANNISSVTDTLGNTWVVALAKQTNNNSPELSNIEIIYVQNCKAGANTVTVNFSATGNFAVWTVAEFSNGVAGTWTVDQTQFSLAAAASTTPTSGATGTLSQADELVVGTTGTVRNNQAGFTAGTGFAIPTNGSTTGNSQSEALEWLESAATTAQNAGFTLTTNTTWNTAVATFIPPPSASVTTLRSLSMSGVGV